MKHLIASISLLAFTISANAQQVSLSVSKDGHMTLNWSVSNPGARDFVALYDGDPHIRGTKGYLTRQWQWASKTSPYVTGTKKGFNFYIAYLAQKSITSERTITAVAGPYRMPDPQVSLTVSNTGYMQLNWVAPQPGSSDFVALFDGDPLEKGTNGYLTNQWQWASKGPSYVTHTKERFSYYAAYIEVDNHKKRRFRKIVGPDTCLGSDPIAGDAYVHTLSRCLTERYGQEHSGSAFALSTGNTLGQGWVAQTPDVWGKQADQVKENAGIFIANDIETMIAGAEHFIDITTLSPFPSGEFQAKILAGLTRLARSGREVTVRILAGWPETSTFTSEGVHGFLNSFANPISKISGSKLTFYVAAQRSSVASWNHSKMVAVDGEVVLLGGENLWPKDYLGLNPVHDLNVKIEGPAAFYAHRFADLLWEGVCEYGGIWKPWSWAPGEKIDHRNCLAEASLSGVPGGGDVSVLGVSRYGTMKDRQGATIQPSDYLMALTMNAARKNIRISQQDLGFMGGLYWGDGMRAIARAIANELDVYIVLSNDGSKGGSDPYSNTSLTQTADKLKSYVKEASGLTGDSLNSLLCRRLHLTTLRFGPSNSWPNGVTFANHSKFFMVDDNVFYVGSSNLYPSDLQEYGVFVSQPQAVSEMKDQYYDPLWEYSSAVAISGSEASSCYFQK